MNPAFQKIIEIAQKSERKILGLMSGTSLDGLDIALCKFSGSGKNTQFQIEKFTTVAYSKKEQKKILSFFAKKQVDLQGLTLLNTCLGKLHGKMILQTLKDWKIKNTEIDLIASHGQTIFHAPRNLHQIPEEFNATLQISDADQISFLTQRPVISDFRQKHTAAGGEGAPLASYGDFYLFSSEKENRIMLNIGGIANFTFLPKNQNPQEIIATDTGTGNKLIDQAMQFFFNKSFDENGNTARKGKVDFQYLAFLKNHSFFKRDFPKTTGPEMFSWEWLNQAKDIFPQKAEDLLITLTKFTAETIAEAIEKITPKNSSIYISGGGTHNSFLMEILAKELPNYKLFSLEKLGVDSDSKEALLFAVLANEWLYGEGIALNGMPSLSLGKLSLP